jgi:hypothetical protein
VRDALATLPWAKDVQVNYDRKQATFSADAERYDEAAILQALEKEGFGGKVISK